MDKIDNILAECNSWNDFWLRANALSPTTQKGMLFERLSQLYLLTQPEYQSRLKNVWNAAVDLPDNIRRTLNLPVRDEGIDLIAETRDGEYWAIQCKFKGDTDKAVTRKELSTFDSLAFNHCKNIVFGLVTHTSKKPIKKIGLMGNTVEIGLERWLEIDAEGWKRIQALIQDRSVAPERRSPRPHQKDAISASVKHFIAEGAERGRMIMPCGTGKSLTAFWIAQALDVKTILVAVPSLALIKQSLADWTREFLAHGQIPEWLCVCSDETVGEVHTDDILSHAYDLGIDTTTDAETIAKFLSKKTDSPKIVFATYQSGMKLGEGALLAECEIDLAILDEAHKTVGKKDKLFASLLSDENVPIKRRLFMTATERILQARSDDVLSMDDEAVYGERFYHLTFKEAIEAEPPIISDYKVVTIAVTDERLAEMIDQNEMITPEGANLNEQEAQSLAAGVALRRTFNEYGAKHAISFHRSIKAASNFSDQQNTLSDINRIKPKIEAVHISSKKSAGERASLMKQFSETQFGLVTNARCLTEGVDVPSVDCVVFADPKNSVVDIVQAAGRALRIHPGKEYGYIMLPVVVPKGMDFDDYMETTPFRQIARVIAALSTQDERIAEQFREAKSDRKPEDRIIEFEVDISIGSKIDLDALYEKIEARVWERVGKANWRPYYRALDFARDLKLESREEWLAFTKSGSLPNDIPTAPQRVYRNKGWRDYPDWLGVTYLPFEEARDIVRGLNLKLKEWFILRKTEKLPDGIPVEPRQVYHNKGWKDYPDWLGAGTRPFEEARNFARGLNLETPKEWKVFANSDDLPYDIPADPNIKYRDEGWKSYSDWLNRPFEEAREFARGLNLRTSKEWKAFAKSGKLPNDIPAEPNTIYYDEGWNSYSDWLNRPFEEARDFAHHLKLESREEWLTFTSSGKLPSDIPIHPDAEYSKLGWKSYGDWLGIGTLSFEEARDFTHGLELKNSEKWFAYCRSGSLPDGIPTDPQRIYRNHGWVDWKDWLGKK
jgi:superfamily II DNA or RNA helicase